MYGIIVPKWNLDGIISASIIKRKFRNSSVRFVDFKKFRRRVRKGLEAYEDIIYLVDFPIDSIILNALKEFKEKYEEINIVTHSIVPKEIKEELMQIEEVYLMQKANYECSAEKIVKLLGGDYFSEKFSKIAHDDEFFEYKYYDSLRMRYSIETIKSDNRKLEKIVSKLARNNLKPVEKIWRKVGKNFFESLETLSEIQTLENKINYYFLSKENRKIYVDLTYSLFEIPNEVPEFLAFKKIFEEKKVDFAMGIKKDRAIGVVNWKRRYKPICKGKNGIWRLSMHKIFGGPFHHITYIQLPPTQNFENYNDYIKKVLKKALKRCKGMDIKITNGETSSLYKM